MTTVLDEKSSFDLFLLFLIREISLPPPPLSLEYLLGVRVMIQALKRSGTKHDIVILVSPNVKDETRRIFRSDGANVIEIPNIANPYKSKDKEKQRYLSRFEFTLNKLYMWNMTQYQRVVYMDADTIAVRNPDELFKCGHFCAVFMNPCNFHTGTPFHISPLCLLVLSPSLSPTHTLRSLPSRVDNACG